MRINKMKLNRDIFRYINKNFSIMYHSVSGGKDSTFAFLKLVGEPNLKIPIVLLFNDTGLELRSTLFSISKLFDFAEQQGVKTIILDYKPYLENTQYANKNAAFILKESFTRIPQAEKLLEEGKYSKKIFSCCNYLKHRGLHAFAKTTSKNALFTSSIRGGESKNRQLWLAALRLEHSYFNFDIKLNRTVFYPLRDTNEGEVNSFLLK